VQYGDGEGASAKAYRVQKCSRIHTGIGIAFQATSGRRAAVRDTLVDACGSYSGGTVSHFCLCHCPFLSTTSLQEAMQIHDEAMRNRRVDSTVFNVNSSRSHCFCLVGVMQGETVRSITRRSHTCRRERQDGRRGVGGKEG